MADDIVMCRRCGYLKSTSEFSTFKRISPTLGVVDQRRSYCIECQREAQRERNKRRPPTGLAALVDQYLDVNGARGTTIPSESNRLLLDIEAILASSARRFR